MTTANFIKRSKGYDKSAKTITDVYQVQVDAANDTDDAIAAVEAVAVPGGYFTDSVNASHINRNPFWYEVTATYKQTISGGGGGADDPLERPSVLSASYEEWTEGYDIDFTTPTPKPVTNSAGDPFQAYPQRKNGRLVLQVTKNFAAFNAVGYRQVSSGEPFPILDGNGNPTEEPWPLNGSGAPLALGATPAELTFRHRTSNPSAAICWGILSLSTVRRRNIGLPSRNHIGIKVIAVRKKAP